MPTCFFPLQPNARGEPPPEAGARHARTLEAVGSSARFGEDAAWDYRANRLQSRTALQHTEWPTWLAPVQGGRLQGRVGASPHAPSGAVRIAYSGVRANTHALILPTFFASTGSVSRSIFRTSPGKAR